MITPEDFRAWHASLELADGKPPTGIELAKMFGKSPDTIARWRQRGVPDRDAEVVRLAMHMLHILSATEKALRLTEQTMT